MMHIVAKSSANFCGGSTKYNILKQKTLEISSWECKGVINMEIQNVLQFSCNRRMFPLQ
jgi:hypothetical protein